VLNDAYNGGSRNIEEIFRDLLALTRVLTEEQAGTCASTRLKEN